MYEREIQAMEHAAKLLLDIDRRGGLCQGGEQYPNGLCCIEDAQQLQGAANNLRELDVLRNCAPPPDRMAVMVDRFLAWKLPETVWPDCGRPPRPTDTGTNLLSATEARAMLTHVLLGADTITEQRAEALAKQWGAFEPSRFGTGMLQFHTGLPGVIGLCRAVWAEALGAPPRDMRRAEDLSPTEVGAAITSGEILTVDHDPPSDATVRRHRSMELALALASPEFNTSSWADVMAGKVVDAEIWREWDGTPTVLAHRYMRNPTASGCSATYGQLWPVFKPTPCPCEGQSVQVLHRDGTVTATDKPEHMRWGWTRPYASAADIVAWRTA